MVVVIFEVIPQAGKADAYLAVAAQLRPLLEEMPGFISIERFQSLNNPAKVLSLSLWQDEESVANWRNSMEHRLAQKNGRDNMFAGYTIRVAQVLREYTLTEREQTPVDSQAYHQG